MKYGLHAQANKCMDYMSQAGRGPSPCIPLLCAQIALWGSSTAQVAQQQQQRGARQKSFSTGMAKFQKNVFLLHVSSTVLRSTKDWI